jgi:hypothetical protein
MVSFISCTTYCTADHTFEDERPPKRMRQEEQKPEELKIKQEILEQPQKPPPYIPFLQPHNQPQHQPYTQSQEGTDVASSMLMEMYKFKLRTAQTSGDHYEAEKVT